MGFVREDGDKGLEVSPDKYFRATKSKTTHKKADGFLR